MSEQAIPVAWEVILSTFERAEEWFTRWATEGQILPAQRDTIVPMLRERLENAMKLAQQENQSAAQRLHETSLAQKASDDAREAQFMKQSGEEE